MGEWTHVAVTYDKETKDIRFYRNGKNVQPLSLMESTRHLPECSGQTHLWEKSIGYNGPKYNRCLLDRN